MFLETQTVKFGKKITCLVTLVAWCCMSGLWKNLVAWHPAFCPCFTAAQCKQTCPYGLLFQSSFIISLLHDQANILCFFQISQTLLEIKQTIFKHISLGEPCLLCRESFKTFWTLILSNDLFLLCFSTCRIYWLVWEKLGGLITANRCFNSQYLVQMFVKKIHLTNKYSHQRNNNTLYNVFFSERHLTANFILYLWPKTKQTWRNCSKLFVWLCSWNQDTFAHCDTFTDTSLIIFIIIIFNHCLRPVLHRMAYSDVELWHMSDNNYVKVR